MFIVTLRDHLLPHALAADMKNSPLDKVGRKWALCIAKMCNEINQFSNKSVLYVKK